MKIFFIWFVYYFSNRFPSQSIPRNVKQMVLSDFSCTGKIRSTDLYRQKSMLFHRKGIAGMPDAVIFVKHNGKRYCLICERKGRNIGRGTRKHEVNQVLLYMFILRAYQPYPVLGRIAYNDSYVDIKYDESEIDSMLKRKPSCIRVLNKISR